ncbi:adenylosuccinate lyase [Buchnera aphidicola (Nipponaphis monzeni)]|uniref:Adenylosuccinate lyase n=1 Tax=Buchnera aphidicola (Nipponaphis monzeni) TaxID=2495405 RepID=A0A455TA69_9GAMM|nr:adenylosuccinate lyase [Buchnera aphidicola]BBI01219.1 adenylosuccinate lyase [Buchnera aphidicola (Nipponaphis monzeni)]
MKLSSLTAISPIDGRYFDKNNVVRNIYSEYAFIKFKIKIEILWLKKLLKISEILKYLKINVKIYESLDNILINFNELDAKKIKNIEKTTNHDIKALEYFLKKKCNNDILLSTISEFIHFGCTSDDINNLSYALMLKKTYRTILIPYWKKILNKIKIRALKYKKIALISYTHGQPATPSTIGKEFANFYYRMHRQYVQLKKIEFLGKINGSTGNYNALLVAYPNINWHKISEDFVTSLGLTWNPCTTQIEPHDYIAEFFHCIIRFNTILIDFNRDMWGYISLEYFSQKHVNGEIGSSVMPHKINPINFENSEGNLSMANALMNFMANKLPISRWQRDLTDSTVLRNMGLTISYSVLAYDSCLLGIDKLQINESKMLEVLNLNWEILSEPIQIVMKRYGITNAYEQLMRLTKGKKIDSKIIHNFIDQTSLPIQEKNKLKKLTPMNYIGMSVNIINQLYC